MPARPLSTGGERKYIRFAAVGDSFTCPLDDCGPTPVRGWAELLVGSLAHDHDVSFCNRAEAGATTSDVRRTQTPAAQAHRPDLAAIVAGLHDAVRADWDTDTVRYRLMRSADELAWCGAVLMTVRFHDHAKLLGLATAEERRVSERVDALNDIYDEIDDAYGSIRLDLAEVPEVYDSRFWSTHPLQPSTFGHQVVARAFADLLVEQGLDFRRTGLDLATATRLR
jgi:hypothetical protein